MYKNLRKHEPHDQQNKINIDPNDKFLSSMTKTTILTIISIFFSLLVPISGLFAQIHVLVLLLDIYTNFICVLLTYSIFDKQYRKCCGFCDSNFKKCVFKVGTETTKASQIKQQTVIEVLEEESNI